MRQQLCGAGPAKSPRLRHTRAHTHMLPAAHLALLRKRLHAQQHKAKRQALQVAGGRVCKGGAGRGEAGAQVAAELRYSHHSCRVCADVRAAAAPPCCRPPPLLPPLTIRVMPTITPDTPKMKLPSLASCATSMGMALHNTGGRRCRGGGVRRTTHGKRQQSALQASAGGGGGQRRRAATQDQAVATHRAQILAAPHAAAPTRLSTHTPHLQETLRAAAGSWRLSAGRTRSVLLHVKTSREQEAP